MFPLEEQCLNNAKQITEKVKDFTMLYDSGFLNAQCFKDYWKTPSNYRSCARYEIL